MGDLWIFLEFGMSKILYLKPKFLIIGPKKNPKKEQIVIFITSYLQIPSHTYKRFIPYTVVLC